MKGKAAFVLGAGLGYLFGTPAGREKLDKAKSKLTDSWNDPRVQEKVSDLRNKATGSSDATSGSPDPWASPSPDVSSPNSSTTSSSTTGSSTTGTSGGPDSDYRSTP